MPYTCVNCINDFELENLTNEHIIPSSLGGCLILKKATCNECNNNFLNNFDDFLANKFPPTTLARTDLNIKSSYRKNNMPTTPLIIHDKRLGIIEGVLSNPVEDNGIAFKKQVKKIGNNLYAYGKDYNSALRALSSARGKTIFPNEIDETGFIIPTEITTRSINWDYAKLAAAKVLYNYLVLELGNEIIELEPIKALRNYYKQSFVASTMRIDVSIQNYIMIDEGKFEIPPHHHVIMFDSEGIKPTFICFFGLFWFKFNIDLSILLPQGRLIGIDPRKRQIVESLTKYKGEWRFRTSHNFGWWRRTGEKEFQFKRRN